MVRATVLDILSVRHRSACAIIWSMKGGSPSGGYTIVEALLFLAITAALFVAIFPTISGRQHKTEFTQAVKSAELMIEDTLNDVSTGYYPQTSGSYSCSLDGTQHPVFVAGSGPGQGGNENCIFVGKVIHFGVGSPIQDDQVNIYTVVGRRLDNTTSKQVESLQKSNPVAAAVPGGFDITESVKLKYGLRIAMVKTLTFGSPKSTTGYGAIGIFTTFGQSDAGGLISGNQVAKIGYLGPVDGQQSSVVSSVRALDSTATTVLGDAASGVRLCFTSDAVDQAAVMDIGAKGRQVTVETKIYSKADAFTGGTAPCA